MTVKNEEKIKKIFDKVFGIAYYGEYADDKKNNLGIPYEFEVKGEISELNSKIYDLKCKIATAHMGRNCNIDDYENLNDLTSYYDDLIEKFCYKMFFYGFTLNPNNLDDYQTKN